MARFHLASRFLSLALAAVTAACNPRPSAGSAADQTSPPDAQPPPNAAKVVLQTDWFAQPEHGGFYQALARGWYAEAGLDVTIVPGGPNAMSVQQVLRGSAHFAMNRADTIAHLALNQNAPIVLVMATLQHDAQGIMVHAASTVQSLADLDGRSVMANPGLTWITYLQRKLGIRFNILPHDYSLQRFVSDPNFIQQCLVTNEPFHVAQAGVAVRVLPLGASGFDPYHGIYCLNRTARDNPDMVQRFVAVSIRGWHDFMTGDPSPAFDLIAASNPRMTRQFMEWGRSEMISRQLVGGSDPATLIGQLDPQRLEQMADELRDLELLPPLGDRPVEWYTIRFLPK
jgi:NitT/TauT family transport system substrate-binding protein